MRSALDETGDGLPPPWIVGRKPSEYQTMRLDSMANEGGRSADPNLKQRCTCADCDNNTACTHQVCACMEDCECSATTERTGHAYTLGQSFSNDSDHSIKSACVCASTFNAVIRII